MNPLLARQLTRLYPRGWRRRYGAEFEALLEMNAEGFLAGANVIWSALLEHIFLMRGRTMNRDSRSLGAIFCAYVAAIVAGVNLGATVDDSPLAAAIAADAGLSVAWNAFVLGSMLALAGALAMLIPLVAGALRFAIAQKRRDILFRLLLAPVAAGTLIAWTVGAFYALGGHWAPGPWAILGDWVPSPDWPPLQARWVWGSLTAGLAIVLSIASSVGFYQAIQRTCYAETGFRIFGWRIAVHPLRFARIPGMVTALTIVAVTVGTLAWGIFASLDGAAGFHTYFGPLHTTAAESWLASASVFAVSASIAMRSAAPLLRAVGE